MATTYVVAPDSGRYIVVALVRVDEAEAASIEDARQLAFDFTMRGCDKVEILHTFDLAPDPAQPRLLLPLEASPANNEYIPPMQK